MKAPLADELHVVRCALHQRLKHKLSRVISSDCVRNANESAKDWGASFKLEQLFERTVQFGENQSGLLLGAAGSERNVIVKRAMHNLRCKFGKFTLIYLNGMILQNELEAFRELTAQLTRATAVKHPVLSYWNMYEYLRGLLIAKAKTGDHVIVILDALEQFVLETSNKKQLLLYNLLDWLQDFDIKMGVLGVTDNYNVVDNLEKRVLSRFSNIQIVIERPSFVQIQRDLFCMLSLDDFNWTSFSTMQQPSVNYIALLSQSLKELQSKHNKVLTSLEFDYDIGKPQAFFIRLVFAAVCYLDVNTPLLTAQNIRRARNLLEQDHQLAVLRSVTDHGLALLIGMGHLEKADQCVFTLEMVYARWEIFLRQHDMLVQLPTRSEAQKALEHLLQLKLVKDAGDAFNTGRGGDFHMRLGRAGSLQPEFRVVHLIFAPRTLKGMLLNGSIDCSTILREWALNGN
ncbi:uncharacterized protein CCR75_000107 [Bremia lactucae]|uniref:Origin recognition complex subunit 4 C-terminal domain-containing protein n=1 Tax=Bremia lactucae TaxID=4779 RepID=A0A976IHR7_BRELC|nr:hypothetical protein CCR75_000107 [Bremia lactucae]